MGTNKPENRRLGLELTTNRPSPSMLAQIAATPAPNPSFGIDSDTRCRWKEHKQLCLVEDECRWGCLD
ncbi:hypothetical protein V6N11_026326 [Hibiscus sabdariffa]|uniref:Uncharacterized protein n=1 Tax=Hibiscus sabdariffa TaxID=183260 RepID=A0ABR2SVC6_9ROSI